MPSFHGDTHDYTYKMPSKTKPTDAEIIEVLAVKGMGWSTSWSINNPKALMITRQDGYHRMWLHDCEGVLCWNPLADMNAIHEIEERLTEPQRGRYMAIVETALGFTRMCPAPLWAVRHASPRTCAEALYEALQ